MTSASVMPPVLGVLTPVGPMPLLPPKVRVSRGLPILWLTSFSHSHSYPNLRTCVPLTLVKSWRNWWMLFTWTLRVPTPNWELPLLPSDIPKPTGLRYTLAGRLGTVLAMANSKSPPGETGFWVRRYSPILVSLIRVGGLVSGIHT